MDADQIRTLQAMGIQPWLSNASKKNSPDEWTALRQAVASCTACGLDKTRTQTVFGSGNHQAKLMVIGEAPGFHEDQQGEPFVGRAGQLLNAMLESVGLARSTVYIANILKCRPPNNRDPEPREVALCTPFLTRQIALINPVALLAVGRIAARFLLETEASLGALRGKVHAYGPLNTPLIITYHPAYLLRNPADKKKAWQDLQKIQTLLQLPDN
ncbi:MAG TPA: uracil-DNA glycosylase [Gammaproteobacteria bacterium]|nr:uracil-DNA glycosylase [Gammaproteobacteria bacterium]